MNCSNCVPSAHPTSGMSAWKPPKNSATTVAWRRLSRFMHRPLHTDTANASIDKPIASNNSSTNPMGFPLVRLRPPLAAPHSTV